MKEIKALIRKKKNLKWLMLYCRVGYTTLPSQMLSLYIKAPTRNQHHF